MSPKFMLSSLALVCAATVGALGQTNVVQPQQTAQPQPGQNQAFQNRPAASQNMDQVIAGCLLLANEEQIALAKFADGKAKSDKVKDFARMLSDEHRKVADDLQTIAPQQAQAAKNLGDSSQRQTTSATNRTGAAAQGGQTNQLFEMERRCARRMSATDQAAAR